VSHLALKRRLHARAGLLGHTTSNEPDLRLLADGATLATERAGWTWRTRLPAGTRVLKLLSRSAVPAQILPDSTDHRRLGIAITHLALDGAMIAQGDARRATGWHIAEPDLQWTDGAATVRVEHGPPRQVDITLAPLLRYWLPPAVAGKVVKQAA
jgi:hypothetical protein